MPLQPGSLCDCQNLGVVFLYHLSFVQHFCSKFDETSKVLAVAYSYGCHWSLLAASYLWNWPTGLGYLQWWLATIGWHRTSCFSLETGWKPWDRQEHLQMMGDSSYRIFAKSINQQFEVSMPLTFKNSWVCDRMGIKTLMNTWQNQTTTFSPLEGRHESFWRWWCCHCSWSPRCWSCFPASWPSPPSVWAIGAVAIGWSISVCSGLMWCSTECRQGKMRDLQISSSQRWCLVDISLQSTSFCGLHACLSYSKIHHFLSGCHKCTEDVVKQS